MAYNLITGSPTFCKALLDINSYKNNARFWWTAYDSEPSRHGIGGPTESYLVDATGGVTIIPSFESYWKSSGFRNPFEYDWLNFDAADPTAVRYARIIKDALDEQLIIWGADENSEASLVYACVTEFANGLEVLIALCDQQGFHGAQEQPLVVSASPALTVASSSFK